MMRKARATAATTLAATLTLSIAAPALAAPNDQTNPAGNGVTQITGSCGGSPQSGETATLVVNNNRSSQNGGWGAARIYGTHDVLVPTSFSVLLLDNGQRYLLDSQTKGSGQQSFDLNCWFDQRQAPDGTPLTAQDLLDQNELAALPDGVQPSDLVIVEFLVQAVTPHGSPYTLM